jgi:hypothetical protein
MQTARLVRIAAEAERLRWQRHARRLVIRAIYGVIAGFFALTAIGVLHVVGYIALRLQFTPIIAAAIIFGVDAVLAIIFAVIASRGGPDEVEQEALAVRQKAVAQIGETLAMVSLVRLAARTLGKRGVYGMGLAALTARFLAK